MANSSTTSCTIFWFIGPVECSTPPPTLARRPSGSPFASSIIDDRTMPTLDDACPALIRRLAPPPAGTICRPESSRTDWCAPRQLSDEPGSVGDVELAQDV